MATKAVPAASGAAQGSRAGLEAVVGSHQEALAATATAAAAAAKVAGEAPRSECPLMKARAAWAAQEQDMPGLQRASPPARLTDSSLWAESRLSGAQAS